MRKLTSPALILLFVASVPAAAGTLSVLDDDTYLRAHVAWKTDAAQSQPVPPNWMQPEFDDRPWAREHMPLRVEQYHKGANRANEYRLILARAKFRVRDPADVRDLRLSIRYCGGAVVYLNGKEIVRRHLPDGALERFAYAEGYPDEAYVDKNGRLLQVLRKDEKAVQEHVRGRMSERYRTIDGLALPADALRRGVNVLAVEVHAAPVNPIRFKSTFRKVTYRGAPGVWHSGETVPGTVFQFFYSHCHARVMRYNRLGHCAVFLSPGRVRETNVWRVASPPDHTLFDPATPGRPPIVESDNTRESSVAEEGIP
ncbi:MAG: hypothetical protein R6V58_06055 [Planctomycetota bacterium]